MNLSSRFAPIAVWKQLIGASIGGNITKYGISITEQSNIIIRNIKFHPLKGNDQIAISESKRIWIDHNEFFSHPDLKKTEPDTYVSCMKLQHHRDKALLTLVINQDG